MLCAVAMTRRKANAATAAGELVGGPANMMADSVASKNDTRIWSFMTTGPGLSPDTLRDCGTGWLPTCGLACTEQVPPLAESARLTVRGDGLLEVGACALPRAFPVVNGIW